MDLASTVVPLATTQYRTPPPPTAILATQYTLEFD